MFNAIKLATSIIAASGAGLIADTIFKGIYPNNLGSCKRLLWFAGEFGLGLVATTAVTRAVEKQFDELESMIHREELED